MKKFLVYLIVLCSFFLVSNKVNAKEISQFCEYTEPCLTTEDVENLINNSGIDTSVYDKYVLTLTETEYSKIFRFFVLKSEDVLNANFRFSIVDDNIYYESVNASYYIGGYDFSKSETFDKTFFKGITLSYSENLNSVAFAYFAKTLTNIPYYSNFDVLDQNGNVVLEKNNIEEENKTYNVTFHLNGGYIKRPNVEICNNIGCYLKDEYYYEDYEININNYELANYIKSQYQYKENMVFNGYYYDSKFTKKYNIDDIPTRDIDLYAKFEFENVEDFLENNTFNEYDFDINYKYAVISNGSNTSDVYLGLNIFKTNLEIYNYNKINKNYENGSIFCLSPYYSKNEIYYYKLEFQQSDNYKILILDRDQLDGNYHFLLTNNCRISYTNNLEDVIIYDENNNEIHTNLEPSYSYSQNVLLEMQSGNDLISNFKKYFKYFNKEIINCFSNVWKFLQSSKIIIYISLLITGSLIILIVNSANRK